MDEKTPVSVVTAAKKHDAGHFELKESDAPEVVLEAAAPSPRVPSGKDPGGFCGGPAGPDGYERPSAGRAVITLLEAELKDHPDSRELALSVDALRSGGDPESVDTAMRAVREAGPLVAPHAVLGLLARRHGRPFVAVRELGIALEANPELAVLRREFSEALAQSNRVEEALEQMRTYSSSEPDDWEAARRVRLMEVQRDVEAGFSTTNAEDFPLRYDPEVPRATVDALLDALRHGAPRAERLLGPLKDPVAVALYRERADLLASTCAQGWAHAVYDGRLRFQDEKGGALTRPEYLRRVVVHELTHVVHRRAGARGDGWLVEGLARYVAQEEDKPYRRSVQMIAESGGYIPFSSMLPPMMGLEAHDDSALAYDQSLLMVHWLVDTAGEEGLEKLLRSTDDDGIAALARVMGMPADDLGPSLIRYARRSAH